MLLKKEADQFISIMLGERFKAVCPCCQQAFFLSKAGLFFGSSFTQEAAEIVAERQRIILDRRTILTERKRRLALESEQLAISVNLGCVLERLAPSLGAFPFHANDCRSLFEPIDYVIFDGMTRAGRVDRIIFADIKTGRARLSHQQQVIKKLIRAGEVKMGYLHNGGGSVNKEVLKFFSAQRQIFGVCPQCSSLFRLSDCKVFSSIKPSADWMDDLLSAEDAVWRQEERLCEAEERIRCEARERGRKEALKTIRKLDQVFAPRKIAAEDVVGIFHPVDYLVFEERNAGETKSLLFLDRDNRAKDDLHLQRSIEEAIQMQRYDWVTLRISNEGEIKQE